ncbi:hypothetical protein SD70_27230 [Gordoniibacillus kamchatkensis]|uniref:Uncharacterized protein n=1 Tax=Gordoniibacillus kamchatkensis TaxID=1590651 RepID=A0ABR5AB98_9BACL|nr:hypothetical protein [Paenibacillus sp. VKM B-2647]KIL38311.1 hypothetical protein SD70_27230 [Paenibacillus sp. VKM B-2647]
MLPKTILRGYDKVTMKYVAKALNMPLPKKKHKGGEQRRMKIPLSALKKDTAAEKKKGKGVKFGAMKGKNTKSDNDADDK